MGLGLGKMNTEKLEFSDQVTDQVTDQVARLLAALRTGPKPLNSWQVDCGIDPHSAKLHY